MTIAVDAALSDPEKIGKIFVKEGPIEPGSGLGKKLPHVGDISVTGVVNFFQGHLTHLRLQSTNLSIVYELSKTIASGIKSTINKLQKESLINENLKEAAITNSRT